jgi:hypothetical protein
VVTEFLNDIYHCFVEVRNWISIFFIFPESHIEVFF